MNAEQPWAEAVAIYDGKILAVGGDAEIAEASVTPERKTIDAGGRLVLPGFVDCHIHFLDGSLSLGRANLEGAKDLADIQQTIARIRRASIREPIGFVGAAGITRCLAPKRCRTRNISTELFPDRPVFLEGYDGHTYWANSKALRYGRDYEGHSGSAEWHDRPRPTNRRAHGSVERVRCGPGRQDPAETDSCREIGRPPRRYEMGERTWADASTQRGGKISKILRCLTNCAVKEQQTLRFYIAYFLNPPELRARGYRSDRGCAQEISRRVDRHRRGEDDDRWGHRVAYCRDARAVQRRSFDQGQVVLGSDRSIIPRSWNSISAGCNFSHMQLGIMACGRRWTPTRTRNRANHSQDRRPRIEHIETIHFEGYSTVRASWE